MPKNEFDLDDPLELNGVALWTDEETQRDMAECFTEEFLRLGCNHKQLLAMFRNPHYLGLNMVLQNKGEAFVKDVIADVFARWGKRIEWPPAWSGGPETPQPPSLAPEPAGCGGVQTAPPTTESERTDPLGNPVPELNL